MRTGFAIRHVVLSLFLSLPCSVCLSVRPLMRTPTHGKRLLLHVWCKQVCSSSLSQLFARGSLYLSLISLSQSYFK